MIRPQNLAASLLVILFLLPLVVFPESGLFLGYFLFVTATILVVRSVPVQPGAWLGQRRVRRGLVAIIGLALLLLTVMSQQQQRSGSTLVLLFLAMCFVVLGRATRRIATAGDEAIDERQESLRNRAHRIAYAILASLVACNVLIAYTAGGQTRAWLSAGLSGGPIATFFLLLFFLPAMVVAWLEPDRLSGDAVPTLAGFPRARLALAMVVIAMVVPLAAAASLVLLPVTTTATERTEPSATAGLNCKYFHARSRVGLLAGALIPLTAVACSDGQKAAEDWGLNDSDCHLASSEFTVVETVQCKRTTDSDGTLRFTYRARVRSAILPFVTRDVVMSLALARDGRVLQFP